MSIQLLTKVGIPRRRHRLAGPTALGAQRHRQANEHGDLAILVDHDDADREFAYECTAATFDDAEPITAVAARLGWTTVSMANDWETVFGQRA